MRINPNLFPAYPSQDQEIEKNQPPKQPKEEDLYNLDLDCQFKTPIAQVPTQGQCDPTWWGSCGGSCTCEQCR